MVKVKVSHTIDKQLVDWLENEIETKRFASISHGIEYALTAVKGLQNQPQNKPKNTVHSIKESDEIIAVSLEVEATIDAMRNKWWNDKQIGLGIVKAGGMGIINLTNIIQKNPDLFETKEECKVWLYNKLKTEPPVIETETPSSTRKLHPKIPLISSADTTEPPKFTPNRTIIKCPGCGEEHLKLSGSTVRKCRNCGANMEKNNIKPQPDQHAPALSVPTSPPMEACQ